MEGGVLHLTIDVVDGVEPKIFKFVLSPRIVEQEFLNLAYAIEHSQKWTINMHNERDSTIAALIMDIPNGNCHQQLQIGSNTYDIPNDTARELADDFRKLYCEIVKWLVNTNRGSGGEPVILLEDEPTIRIVQNGNFVQVTLAYHLATYAYKCLTFNLDVATGRTLAELIIAAQTVPSLRRETVTSPDGVKEDILISVEYSTNGLCSILIQPKRRSGDYYRIYRAYALQLSAVIMNHLAKT